MKGKPEKPRKTFLSDWELRRMIPFGRKTVLPENSIISPLSLDWLDYGESGEMKAEDSRVRGPEDRQRRGSEGRRGGEAFEELELRRQIAAIGRRLYALGFVPATDGNISVRLPGGLILITPSGVPKGALAPEDVSKIAPDGRLISGKKPSSEYLLHLCVYKQRSDVMAVVHAHPPLATGLACAGAALETPLTSEMVIALGKVPLAEYATPGTTEVSDSIVGLVKDHDAIMLSNHGVVTCGRDLETAFQRMETVEQAAKITLVTEHLGGGRSIPPDKVAKLEEIRRQLGL
jgi:L-fuculose-phosphate aldolase